MNSPYDGNFRVSQEYKGVTHDGLDLVGVDSKEIHSTINGVVEYANWENVGNHKQGFGQYVRIRKDGTDDKYYFGHLSAILTSVGQHVQIGQVIGIEGSTGHSTGSHLHYCVRPKGVKANCKDISAISGIPNKLGTYNDGFVGAFKSTSVIPQPVISYYPATSYNGVSITAGLKAIGVDSSMANRKVIASKNGISGYSGTVSQNTQLLKLLKAGKLVK